MDSHREGDNNHNTQVRYFLTRGSAETGQKISCWILIVIITIIRGAQLPDEGFCQNWAKDFVIDSCKSMLNYFNMNMIKMTTNLLSAH